MSYSQRRSFSVYFFLVFARARACATRSTRRIRGRVYAQTRASAYTHTHTHVPQICFVFNGRSFARYIFFLIFFFFKYFDS